jgi:hypothetical protein
MRRNQALVRIKEFAEKSHDEIAKKCHPAVFELAAFWKEHIRELNALGRNPSLELATAFEARIDKQLAEIQRKYASIPCAPSICATQTVFSKSALTARNDGQGVAEGLHFMRHGTVFEQDVRKYEARNGAAAQRILKSASEWEGLRCERKRPKPYKNDIEHFTMLYALWDFGIGELTPNTLAAFFDYYCPCSTDSHDPDAVRKQRKRFENLLKAAGDSPQ